MRVLLVEDNERLRALTRKQLQDAGFAVDAVGDLAAADAAARAATFDRRSGRVATKAEIERAIYAFDDEVSANTIEVLVHRLRKRLSDGGSRLSLETLRGIGYMLRDPSA